MKAYYRLDSTSDIGYNMGGKPRAGFIDYDTENPPAELKILLDANNVLKAIAHFKSLYLEIFNAKLKELDYDSIATVQLWMSDATFGTEATQIMDWYKAIITKNYVILNDAQTSGIIPTDEEYLAEIAKVVF